MCSRREADRLIEQGRVFVNGKRASLGQRVNPGDEVVVDSQKIRLKTKHVYMAFHKPVGITTTTDPKDPTNVIRFIDYHERLFPVGRLDKDSEGLLLLTNDGDIVNKILRAGNAHEKEYIVKVQPAIHGEFIDRMASGVPILGTKTLPCPVQQLSKNTFRITLIQGMNRQIRRMCEVLGYSVIELKRVRIMSIPLGDLKPGRWRLLTPAEVKALQTSVATSTKTQRAPARPSPSGHKSHPRKTSNPGKSTSLKTAPRNAGPKRPKA